MSGIERLRDTWDALGVDDPLWAVLSTPESRGNRWDVEDFFATGVDEVTALLHRLRGLHIDTGTERALDFGCGAGRITQALAPHFARVDGVDIAPSMIELAGTYNKHADRCFYHVNEQADLSLFEDESFDLVYSRIVLMHVPPRYSRRYIADFARVVKPDGVVVFHVPSGMTVARRALYEVAVARRRVAQAAHPVLKGVIKRTGLLEPFTSATSPRYKHAMYFIPKRTVKRLLTRNSMSLVVTEETESADVHDVLYYARKRRQGHG